MSLEMGSFFNPQNNHGIMDDEQVRKFALENKSDEICNSSSNSTSSFVDEDQEVNSSDSSSTTSPSTLSPLQDMSSLLQPLPFKRGLSKYYHGKSQSFTCLSNVRCLEDLAKPENPYNKRLKTCQSYAGLVQQKKDNMSAGIIDKNLSSNMYNLSSIGGGRRDSSYENRWPPIPPPHRSASTSSFKIRPLCLLEGIDTSN